MKKILFAGSALAVFTLLSGPVHAEAPSLRVGGQVDSAFTYSKADSDDEGVFSQENEARVWLRGGTVLDNGLAFDTNVEFETDTASDTVTLREANVAVGGSFGTLIMGEDEGVSQKFSHVAPYIGFDLLEDRATVLDDREMNKVTYLSPSFSGFQAGGSFAPEAHGDDVVSVGASYQHDIGPVKFGADVSYATADSEVDNSVLRGGLNVSFQSLTVGGSFARAEQGDDELKTYDIGARYDIGPAAFSATYTVADAGSGEASALSLGARYAVAPGIELKGEVISAEDEAGEDSVGAIAGVRMTF